MDSKIRKEFVRSTQKYLASEWVHENREFDVGCRARRSFPRLKLLNPTGKTLGKRTDSCHRGHLLDRGCGGGGGTYPRTRISLGGKCWTSARDLELAVRPEKPVMR